MRPGPEIGRQIRDFITSFLHCCFTVHLNCRPPNNSSRRWWAPRPSPFPGSFLMKHLCLPLAPARMGTGYCPEPTILPAVLIRKEASSEAIHSEAGN